ncbi:hypothetical protein T4C_9753 [Trichinella pseudospiralis]|uniref:Uncharacterized protein n=1 Tax=Trichinella pseudospiralis TaxID=6337 RepID=A0A0V1K2E2_TRIPS|nr:hypothetical protein T4C_9753 [Trichinella pseudospiralis]
MSQFDQEDKSRKVKLRIIERLIKSPARVDHDINFDAGLTNWAVSDPGNIFCRIHMLKIKLLNLRWQFALIKLIFSLDLLVLLLKLKTIRSENIHEMIYQIYLNFIY